MAGNANVEKTAGGKGSTDRLRLGLMLGSTLLVGFLLGYLASAFVPLIRPPQASAPGGTPASATRLSPSEVGSALKAAHAALDAGDLQAAWDKYHQILMADAHNVEALTHLGNILMQNGQVDEAIRLYNRALSFDANYAHALYDKGQALKQKGDVKGAAEVWKRFLTLMPEDTDDAKRVKGWLAELGKSGASAKNASAKKEAGTVEK